MDSMEEALAASLVDAYVGWSHYVRPFRGGLGRARSRTMRELVHAKIEGEFAFGRWPNRWS
jgi:hypothetical protein